MEGNLNEVVKEYEQKIAELSKITAELPQRLGISLYPRYHSTPRITTPCKSQLRTAAPCKSPLSHIRLAPVPANHVDDGSDVMGQFGEGLVDTASAHGAFTPKENTTVPPSQICLATSSHSAYCVVHDESNEKISEHSQGVFESENVSENSQGVFESESEPTKIAFRWAALMAAWLEHCDKKNIYTMPLRPTWQLRAADADDSVEDEDDDRSHVLAARKSVMGKMPLMEDASMLARHTERAGTMPHAYVGSTRASGLACMRSLVRHPDGRCNRAYALFSTCVISFDVLMLPMMAFPDESKWKFVSLMELYTAIFWTVDIVMSCFAGFYTESAMVEMRPREIILNYLKTWFAFDISITSTDWFFLTILDEQNNFIRMAKAMKVTRIFRALRVLRVAKAFLYFQRNFITFASDLAVVLAKVVWTSILIVVVNHYLACGWFALAYWNKEDAATWLKAHNGEDAAIFMQYLMSYHWSITQFTPATNNIAPLNERERLFAVLTVLFALVMFSNFLSRLTTAMAEIHRINAANEVEKQSIKRFFITRNVSLTTANRIWCFYRHHFQKSPQIMLVSDVPFFNELPSSAKRALYKDVYAVTLMEYQLFSEIGRWGWSFFQALCSDALSEKLFNLGGEVFHKGDESCHMYIGTMGTLSYEYHTRQFASAIFSYTIDDEKDVSIHQVWTPTIVSEVALWTQWHHVGNLVARSPSHVICIDCDEFVGVVDRKVDRSSRVFRALLAYAVRYIQYVSDSYETDSPVTDVVSDFQATDIRRIAQRAFRNPNDANATDVRKTSDLLYFAAMGRLRSDQDLNLLRSESP